MGSSLWNNLPPWVKEFTSLNTRYESLLQKTLKGLNTSGTSQVIYTELPCGPKVPIEIRIRGGIHSISLGHWQVTAFHIKQRV